MSAPTAGDEYWVDRVRQGDRAALELLFRRYVDRVFGSEAKHERYFEIGSPLDMDATVCLNLDRFVERSNGVFGKYSLPYLSK